MTNDRSEGAVPFTKEQLEALVSSRTSEVFHELRRFGPLTVPEIQKRLGFESKAVYYQVQKLERVGLVVEAGSDRQGVKAYQVAVARFTIPDGFQGLEYERLAAKAVRRSLEAMAKRFEAVAEKSEERPEMVDELLIHTSVIHASPDRRNELRKRLQQLVSEYRNPQTADDAPLYVLVATAPGA